MASDTSELQSSHKRDPTELPQGPSRKFCPAQGVGPAALMKLCSFESHIFVCHSFPFALLLLVGCVGIDWNGKYSGESYLFRTLWFVKGFRIISQMHPSEIKDSGERGTQPHVWIGNTCRAQWNAHTERASVYPSSREVNWVLKNSGTLLIGSRADLAAVDLKFSFPGNWSSFLLFPFFLSCVLNLLLLLLLLSVAHETALSPQSNVNRVLDGDITVELRCVHCYKRKASSRLWFNEAISKQLKPLFAFCLCLQIQHNFVKSARKWQESSKITHNSRDWVKANCHRLFLWQFERADETGPRMQVSRSGQQQQPRVDSFPAISPLRPRAPDSTAVLKIPCCPPNCL